MENYKKTDEENIKEVKEKFTLLMNIIDTEINPKYFFDNKEVFLRVKSLFYEVVKQFNEITFHPEGLFDIYVALITEVKDIIDHNNEYHNEITEVKPSNVFEVLIMFKGDIEKLISKGLQKDNL